MASEPEYVECEVTVIATTGLAALLRFEDGEEEWVPWSLIEDNGENAVKRYRGPLWIADWKLEELGQL